MSFFGLTALGPQSHIASSLRTAYNLQVFKPSEYEAAFRRVSTTKPDGTCVINAPTDLHRILRDLFRGEPFPQDKELFDQSFSDLTGYEPSSSSSLESTSASPSLSGSHSQSIRGGGAGAAAASSSMSSSTQITFDEFMRRVDSMIQHIEEIERDASFRPGGGSEYKSSDELARAIRGSRYSKRQPTEKYWTPPTSNHDYGWSQRPTDLQVPRHGIKSSEQTKYVGELLKAGVYF